MMFLPGVTAATAYELGELCEDEQKTKQRLEEESATPVTYKRVLQQMDEEILQVIEHDERKLEKEAQKITHLQSKIEKEERKYVDMKRELGEDEEIEAELQAEKLKKEEEKLAMIKEGRDHSPVLEKIGEVFHEAKDFAKDALENVGDLAHLCFANKRESTLHEKNERKTEKKLKAAAQRIDNLRKELAEKRKAMIKEDSELLRKEAQKIERLQEQLEEEERKYNEICAELTEELNYERRIREEEQKLKEFELAEESNLTSAPCCHHHHRQH